jgi:uncharacterized lipoprotein YddW (UPF0748 family)
MRTGPIPPLIPSLLWLAMSLSSNPRTAGAPPPAPRGDEVSPRAEVRGTWLTTTANDALATPEQTALTMRRLRAIGLNTVYVECWKNGYTEFPSATLYKTIGIPCKINLPGQPKNRDLLRETLLEAHRNGLLCFAWFEYGFMAASKDTHNELRAKKPQWLLRDRNGSEVAPDGMIWMNPLHPEVRTFLLNLILDAALNYDLDGIQLDDRLAWPDNTMGYDDYTKQAYANEHGGHPPPKDPDAPEWVKWRAQKVTAFAKEFHDAVRKARPDILISVSPSPYPWSLEHHAADWPTWARNGWMDEYVPQLYRDHFAQVAKEWPAQLALIPVDRRRDLVGGFRIVGDGPDTPWDDLRKMADLVRASGGGGHCWWFSRGVLDVYARQLTDYYDVATAGPAPHPKRPLDWRPPPIEGEKRSSHWTLNVTHPGTYAVIVKNNGAWTLQRTIHAQRGQVDVRDQKYDAVELLLDRRGR